MRPVSRRDSDADLVLVDDDTLVHLFVQRRLRGTGLQLIAFTEASKALAWLQAHRPRLLMLDHRMPAMSGLELLEALGGAQAAAERIVLCSAAYRTAEFAHLDDCHGVTVLDKAALLDRGRFLDLLGLQASPDREPMPTTDDQMARESRSLSRGSSSTSPNAV